MVFHKKFFINVEKLFTVYFDECSRNLTSCAIKILRIYDIFKLSFNSKALLPECGYVIETRINLQSSRSVFISRFKK